ncbi:MAG TPA: FtsX-like permease family protein [Thermomicrobiales bacterium]|nr:FtsX-like permease family protein [Thermomicrobiales bacterium]
MTTMFGIPMQGIMVALLAITAVCLSAVAFTAWRNRTMFWVGVRNVPRRRAQTVLIVFGLMLATAIIASALTIGDTLTYSIKQQVYDRMGAIDLTVVKGREEQGAVVREQGPAGYFDRATYQTVRARLAGDPAIDGLAPVFVAQTPMIDPASQLGEPAAATLAIDPADAAALGGVRARDGGTLDLGALRDDEIVVNAALAESLQAHVGDRLTVFVHQEGHHQQLAYTVAGIAANGGLGGFSEELGRVALLPARALPALAGQDGVSNMLLVSARGDASGGLAHEPAARAALERATAGTGLVVESLKRDGIAQAEQAGNSYTSIFFLCGLFAIAAGVVLIFLIFVMLAAERRGEMGMARAVGTKRRHLVQAFVAEGAAYDLLAAAVGAVAGVGLSALMVRVGARLLARAGEGLALSLRVEPRSLAIAYCLGVVVTFITIAVSSWRVSRLNIVAAIRDLEDAPMPGGTWRGLALGVGGVALGALLWATAGSNGTPFTLGVSTVILAATLVLRRLRLPDRLLGTLAGAALLAFWSLPTDTSDRLFGKHVRGTELFFVAGIMMVAGAALVLVNNAGTLAAALGAVARVARRFGSALRMGLAYPAASRFRTGLTLYMFALITFLLILMAGLETNVDRLLNDPAKQAGGWDVAGTVLTPVGLGEDAVRRGLAAGGVAPDEIAAIGGYAALPAAQTELRTVGGANPAGGYPVKGVDDGFLAASGFHLRSRAEGYADDAAVWRALRADPTLAVVDAMALSAPGGMMGDGWRAAGIAQNARTFAPLHVELRSPQTGRSRTVTVIGVTDNTLVSGFFVRQETVDAVFGPQPVTHYLFKLRPGADDRATARRIEAALLTEGLQADSIHEQLARTNGFMGGFFALLQGFIALGLVVGIAALGVVAFRAVVERRQQIGMLRAIGFQRRMVSLAFLIEALFVTVLGVAAGVTTALVLTRNVFMSGDFGDTASAQFFVPWAQVALFAGIALVAALATTLVPSWQAGRVAPAEALRYE